MHAARPFVSTAVFFLALLAVAVPAAGTEPVRLVLFITVDQLRGDVLPRMAPRFDEGGFRSLLTRGTHYTNAHYRHATTFTSVGHATLFTGGNPPEHGIVANDWRDLATGVNVYSVADDQHPRLDAPSRADLGRSPHLLTSSTIGDELITGSEGRSRVFSVSAKDRGAILPAGRLGTAYWYETGRGRFTTSTYYMADYPAWVDDWNAAGHADAWRGGAWTLLRPPSDYERADADDRPFESASGSLGRTFPHPLTDQPDAPYTGTLRYTPMLDELTAAFAAAVIEQERLGQGSVTDMLAVSLSATDTIGHAFGPHSLEAEDNLYRLDRTIARLLARVDALVGLDRTLVVLSSDHGVDAAPEHRRALAARGKDVFPADAPSSGCEECAGRLIGPELVARANDAVQRAFGVDDAVIAFTTPALYLDVPRLAALDLDAAAVERVVAEEMTRVPGLARAFARSDLLAGRVADDAIARRVRRAFHPRRSGHVILVPDAFWDLFQGSTITAMHGSPYAYDTHVPIVIAGPDVPARTVHRRVAPGDVAPTLALFLGTPMPSGAVGDPLVEVLPSAPR